MINNVKLTIAIPTHNRVNELKKLVENIESVVVNLGLQDLEILISNNYSGDDTEIYLTKKTNPIYKIYNHKKNIGPQDNIKFCLEKARGQYTWIIGDDDNPDPSLIPLVLDQIKKSSPDLIYVKPIFSFGNIKFLDRDKRSHRLEFVSKEKLASKVGHLLTFISSIVIKTAPKDRAEISKLFYKHKDSYLQALTYSLYELNFGFSFIYISRPNIYCTSGQTNYYPALRTFGISYPYIVEDILGANSFLAKILLRSVSRWHLPGIAWACRNLNGKYGDLLDVDFVVSKYHKDIIFLILFVPIAKFPMPIAFIFYQAYRGLSKINRIVRVVM